MFLHEPPTNPSQSAVGVHATLLVVPLNLQSLLLSLIPKGAVTVRYKVGRNAKNVARSHTS